jgi:hypothetical protein
MAGLPTPRIPSLNLPQVRALPSVPGVGCAGGDATAFFGEQFGGLPDIQSVLHIKSLKKHYEEMMATLIEGYLNEIPRQALWAARVAEYTNRVADLVGAMTGLIAGMTAEVGASVAAINETKDELQGMLDGILEVPAAQRDAAQRLMATRYQQYLGELDTQAGRLQATLACLSA